MQTQYIWKEFSISKKRLDTTRIRMGHRAIASRFGIFTPEIKRLETKTFSRDMRLPYGTVIQVLLFNENNGLKERLQATSIMLMMNGSIGLD